MLSELMPYEKKFASVNGKKIAYVEVGEGNPIVLLHLPWLPIKLCITINGLAN